jgi:integrase
MAHSLQKAAREARQQRLTEARTRELLSEILESVGGGGLRMFSVAEWFDHFVKGKQKSRADKTAQRHQQVMRDFFEFLGPKARLNIAAITSFDIANFRLHRETLGLAPSTLNGDVAILSAAFNAALKQGHVTVNPCAAIEPVRDKVTERKEVFTPEQVAAILKAVEDTQFAAPRGGKLGQDSNQKLRNDWRGLILTAFYTGQRLGDCATLKWKQINLAGEIKAIRFQQGKTGREIVAVIHPELEKYFLGLPSSDDENAFLFPSLARQAERHISPMSKAFRKLMARAGIKQHVIRDRNAPEGSGRKVNALSFHSLRHGFVSCLANAGIPEEIRMALTGHTSREMGQHYTHRELALYRDAVAVLPRL